MAPEGLIKHLGHVARRRREEADLLIAEICARLRHDSGIKKTDGALSRFERGATVPTFLDAVVAAYAAETGDDPFDYWNEALADYAAATGRSSAARAAAGAALEVEAQEAARQRGGGKAARAQGSRAARKRRAGG